MSDRLASLVSPGFLTFVKENENADVNQLLLSKVPDGIDAKLAADQILSRRKAKDKLPDWYAISDLVFPPPLSLEQSSSQKAADYKKIILKGSRLVDLTGGMGVDLLTLSENFEQATYVEMDPWLCEAFGHNAGLLSKKPIQILNQTAERFLAEFEGKATFFIDPARRDDAKRKVFRFEDCSPNVTELFPLFEEKAEQVLIKAAPMIDITAGIKVLRFVKEVHVLSIHNECKEVLFLLDFDFQNEPEIRTINLGKEREESFSYRQKEETNAQTSYSRPKKFLYEPNASIRKAGAFKLVGQRYGLDKIAPNTHLYTSDKLVEGFPGRIFEAIDEVNKKNFKKHFPTGKANVISKNHPLSVEQIKRKFGLKDGGNQFLIGMRGEKGQVILLNCRKAV